MQKYDIQQIFEQLTDLTNPFEMQDIQEGKMTEEGFLMDKLTVMKIPEEILRTINEKRNKEYITRIDKNDIFNEKNVSKSVLDLICYFEYNYWMDDIKKHEIDEIHKRKFEKNEAEKRKKYNYNNLFSKK